jgi:hypothetical protein
MSNEIHYQILPETQVRLYNRLKKKRWIKSFYLAGGTALALQIGHRQSNDFDFFTLEDFNNDHIASIISETGKFSRLTEEKNTLHGYVDDVNISFLGYKYPILKEHVQDGYIRIASIIDIACMKLSAITSRGSKKDFIDIFFILKQYPISELISWFSKKYTLSNYDYLLLKSLVYFNDADEDPMPLMLGNINWDHVKDSIIKEVKRIKI